jgi:hypothetical protein
MIERDFFKGHPLVLETLSQEIHQSFNICLRNGVELRERQRRNAIDVYRLIVQVGVGKISTANIKLDDLAQGCRIANVEIGTTELNVPQVGSFESAVSDAARQHWDIRNKPGHIGGQASDMGHRGAVAARVPSKRGQLH